MEITKLIKSKGISLLVYVLIFLLVVHAQCSSPVVIFQWNETFSTLAYSNGSIENNFAIPPETYSCSNYYTYTYNQTEQQFNSNKPYQILINNYEGEFEVNISVIHETKRKLDPEPKNTICFDNCTIQITNNCQEKRSYAMLKISITGLPPIFYNVTCDGSLILSPPQWGLIVLIVFSLVQIIVFCKFQEANSFNNRGHYVSYFSLSIYCICIAIGEALIILELNGSTEVISSLCLGISGILGILGFIVFCSEVLYYFKVKFKKKALVLAFELKVWKIRLIDVIGFIVGVGFMCAWYFSGLNWIISDLIYMVIFLALIKFVKFGSLKMAFIAFVSTAVLNVAFIVYSQVKNDAYFNNVILYIFNNPLFIFFPCITFTVNQTCSWFFITSIGFPGILLSYLYRFDESRSSKIYSLVFLVSFVICAVCWAVSSIFAPYTLPFDLINSPFSIILLCIFANRRGELGFLWNGKIFDAKHKNKSEQEKELKSSLREERSDSLSSDLFRLKFTNLSSASMGETLIKVREDSNNKPLSENERDTIELRILETNKTNPIEEKGRPNGGI